MGQGLALFPDCAPEIRELEDAISDHGREAERLTKLAQIRDAAGAKIEVAQYRALAAWHSACAFVASRRIAQLVEFGRG